MRYLTGILTTLTLLTAIILSGCDSSSNRMDATESAEIEPDRNSEIVSSEVHEEIRVFRLENADRFKEFNLAKSEIEKQIETESDEEVKDRLESKLDEYEEVQSDLDHEIDNFQVLKTDNWDEFKDNFSDKMDDLGKSLNDFFTTAGTNTSSIN